MTKSQVEQMKAAKAAGGAPALSIIIGKADIGQVVTLLTEANIKFKVDNSQEMYLVSN